MIHCARLYMSRAVWAIQSFLTDVLSGPLFEHVIKEPILKSARKEASDLLPHLKGLNAGGLPMPTASPRMTGRLCSSASACMFMCRIGGLLSASALHTWSNQKPSDLKMLMIILGSNGLLHNAQVYEK